MKTCTALFAATALLCGVASDQARAAPVAHDMAVMAAAPATPLAAPQLQAALRTLWHGHVVHTRDYALAVHAQQPAKAKAAADAVVANAKQLATAVGSFYGQSAADRTLQLLAGHWTGVKALTDARFAQDGTARQKAMAALNDNVDAIAVFFSGANPYLPENAVRSLFATHVAHHATEIQQIMAGDMQSEQATWKAMQAHMDVIADAMAGAIARQFPDKAH